MSEGMNLSDRDILVDLRRIIRAVNLEGKRVEKTYGVSIPQYLCLRFLNEAPNFTASLKEIRSALQLNPSTITGIVQRLERGGYAARLPKQDDRRKSLIILTERGAAIVRENPKILHRKLLTRLQELDDAAYDELQSAFKVIIGFLDVEEVDAAPIVTSEATIPSEKN
jgi:DNA-binding MarR family transcriptional regulator